QDVGRCVARSGQRRAGGWTRGVARSRKQRGTDRFAGHVDEGEQKKSLMKRRNVVLLGTTGSIGVSTQKVAADLPDRIRIVGMASRESVDGMEKAIAQFKPKAVAMTDHS